MDKKDLRLIDALYINTGGGKRLLEYLIVELSAAKLIQDYYFIFDNRLESPLLTEKLDKMQYSIIAPGEMNRFHVYWKLRRKVKSIVCLANVPPPCLMSRVPVLIYFHNNVIFGTSEYSKRISMLHKLKLIYIRLLNRSSYRWVVQTLLVREKLIKHLGIGDERIQILPFYLVPKVSHKRNPLIRKELTFIYPAEGYIHKNHLFLFQVWSLLKEKYNRTPKLIVTLAPEYRDLINKLDELTRKGVQIVNVGRVNEVLMRQYYEASDYLIFPSSVESFGLPLLEAVHLGLDVIAVDKDYVHEAIKPSAVFLQGDAFGLTQLIISIADGQQLPPSEIRVKNQIEEFIGVISTL
jgi:glycosyltransferase involved in cell wall biosynthesis